MILQDPRLVSPADDASEGETEVDVQKIARH